jgi:hypothetical protein
MGVLNPLSDRPLTPSCEAARRGDKWKGVFGWRGLERGLNEFLEMSNI